jgi:hypothetical protein
MVFAETVNICQNFAKARFGSFELALVIQQLAQVLRRCDRLDVIRANRRPKPFSGL